MSLRRSDIRSRQDRRARQRWPAAISLEPHLTLSTHWSESGAGVASSTSGMSWASVCEARKEERRRRSSAEADGAREGLSFDAGCKKIPRRLRRVHSDPTEPKDWRRDAAKLPYWQTGSFNEAASGSTPAVCQQTSSVWKLSHQSRRTSLDRRNNCPCVRTRPPLACCRG